MTTNAECIQNYALPLCVHGLSAYAITRQYRPSAHPVITALALNALECVHTWSQIQMHNNLNLGVANFSVSSIGLIFLLIQHRLSLLFPQKLPPFFSAVAINSVSESFGFTLFVFLKNTQKILPQTYQITSWTATGMEIGLSGLSSYSILRYLFKSPDPAITTMMVTLLNAILKIVQSSLASYFDTTNEKDTKKIQSMTQRYHLLNQCHLLITPLAVHRLGQLFLKKTPPYFDVLAMVQIFNRVYRWTLASYELGVAYRSTLRNQ